jgi:hypothetical protein
VEVRLPRELADAAAAAWDRDDLDEAPETTGQRVARERAGSLALIGLAVQETGRREGNHVIVALDAGLIALAVSASDDLATE